ncbi:MAG TPA: hypothetical protein DEA40_00890, partial [Parvularcula sp.]|nr:hypothetical protein [Parvularcula sp.]
MGENLLNEGKPSSEESNPHPKVASRLSTSPQGGGEEAAHGLSRGASSHLLFWSAPQASLAEHGVPYAEGLAQFGVDLGAFLIAATR